ncbi:DUF4136 domain-containing protein [Flavobacterium sp.]|jgi:hypothetical protein|uniref:DUF4136 domain-containing protein n=1 Tax=Flavobacterium sp. TaxID=239 RepID=UPI0025C132A6|nr:DUF4136 domain-containing protein [Flavobacterium sp.]MBA4275392.1 DUF4136 domain-containing protein [Flavobacterium sp.]
MKAIKIIPVLLFFIMSSCGSSINVYSDFDKNTDFSPYKTYAFHQKSIDKVQISELDKRRILQAIESELGKKGMTKSETPDLLINIFTKEKQEVDVNQYYNNWGYGWRGYRYGYPFYWGGYPHVSTSVEGTLFIDLIDAKKNELVWQGEGVGYLTQDRSKKEAIINEFVAKILAQYPPIKK